MIHQIRATNHLSGKVFLPASKSYSIRAFLVAACGGSSRIVHPSNCDDAVVASKIARSLGAKITPYDDNCWHVIANPSKKLPSNINVKESGTGLRLLLPLAALRNEKTTIVGTGTLVGRPNRFLTETIRRMGANIRGMGKAESVPIKLDGGLLQGGKVEIDGSVSSQFVSALLMTLPQLPEDSTLYLKGKLVSQDYIQMTLNVLAKSGIQVVQDSNRIFQILGGQTFKGLKRFVIPSDDGLAAFLMAAALLVKSDVILNGHFSKDLIQADGHIYKLLNEMGVTIKKTSRSIRIKGPLALQGGTFSLKDCPDLVPIMSILALFANKPTKLVDIGHARIKESDRISDLRKELIKTGADIRETKDQLIIYPKEHYKENCTLDPHHDHRLAMSFCVLGLKLGIRVKDTECISKSYPNFLNDFKSIGANVLKKKK